MKSKKLEMVLPNQMKRLMLLLLFLFGTLLGAYAQQQTVRGIVTDDTGETIIGASITVKGTSTGTITDMDGAFSLSVPAGGTLVISYIGYKTQEVPIKGKSTINVV